MTNVVLPDEICPKLVWISFSVFVSKADVASSNKNILGSFSSALAIATRCFSPPESFNPLSPTGVLYPSGRPIIN